jgi:hypothetical protein
MNSGNRSSKRRNSDIHNGGTNGWFCHSVSLFRVEMDQNNRKGESDAAGLSRGQKGRPLQPCGSFLSQTRLKAKTGESPTSINQQPTENPANRTA